MKYIIMKDKISYCNGRPIWVLYIWGSDEDDAGNGIKWEKG